MKKLLLCAAFIMSLTIGGVVFAENTLTTQVQTANGDTGKKPNLSRQELAKKLQNKNLTPQQKVKIFEHIKKSKAQKVQSGQFGSAFR